MRDFLGFTCALGVAIIGGYLLTERSLAVADQLSRQDVGIWNFWPQAGSMDADPYLRAITARRAILPMAQGEGIGLVAQRDKDGNVFNSRCDYKLTGRAPGARAISLSVYGTDGQPFTTKTGRVALTGDEMVRNEEGQFSVSIGPEPLAGNWLPVAPDSDFVVILRLYDTPLGANAAALTENAVPGISKVSCR